LYAYSDEIKEVAFFSKGLFKDGYFPNYLCYSHIFTLITLTTGKVMADMCFQEKYTYSNLT